MKNAKLVFGSIIVILLLGLYGYTLWEAISLARFGTKPVETLPEGTSRTMATVGGLVSALVIAQLAITKPGDPPTGRFVATGFVREVSGWLVPAMSVLYVITWIGLGFAAFLYGELWFPGKVQPLTTFAQAWLGLAVAAGYAYFGIKT